MSKYSHEQKLKVVVSVAEDGLSLREAGKIIGCSDMDVLNWLRLYEQFGPEGLLLRNGTYSGDFKVHAVKYMHDNHLSAGAAAAKLGIPSKTPLVKWERIYYEEGPQNLYKDNRGRKMTLKSDNHKKIKKVSPQKEEDLIAEVQRLRMENEYLKKLNALVQERIGRENGKKPPSSTN